MPNPILVIALSQGVGLLAILAIGYGAIERFQMPDRVRASTLGVWFGLGAILAMSAPAKLAEGFIFDVRCIIIGLAAAFGAPVTIAVSSLMAIGFRLYLGGMGAIPGSVGIGLAAILGFFGIIILRKLVANTVLQYALIGLLISGNFVSAFLLPFDQAIQIIRDTYPLIGITSVIAAALLGSFMDRERRLLFVERHWRDAALRDPLTLLPNRRWFERESESHFLRCNPIETCCLLMIDIDHFKHINDTHGHAAGDEVLKTVAAKIQKAIRQIDKAARVGGEEFAVLLPATAVEQGTAVAERVRVQIASATDWDVPELSKVTISIGVTLVRKACGYKTAFQAADRALYNAKFSGRNRVEYVAITEVNSDDQTIFEDKRLVVQ
jgi:diguanylate cyclase